MAENNNLLAPLNEKLESLKKRHETLSVEIRDLSEEMEQLKNFYKEQWIKEENASVSDIPDNLSDVVVENRNEASVSSISEPKTTAGPAEYFTTGPAGGAKIKSDLEKFIGENLLNKIGIAITVIGVAIGTKYSIDHNLISPLARIILGYLMGLGLLGIGIKLKKNYENYSAVLVSGAIAILYFMTYFAYSLYGLIPQFAAFALMVVFTAFTVAVAINYNNQIISHIGMVGAYAVPFLLGDSTGNVSILFGYMAIINIGILLTAFKKYWKPLYYASFVISWLIYFSWFSEKFRTSEYFELGLIFLTVFFIIFYAVFLAYKLVKKEKFDIDDVFLLLANSFIFFGLGYSILKTNDTGAELLGVFTLCNAAIHFGVGVVIYNQKLADRNLFYLVAGLVLVFITLAVPVQLHGNWVTLLWACEAALLFWIGRTKNVQFYERIAYALILLTFISIVQDWMTVYNGYVVGKPETRIIPLFNINFLTSLFVVASFGYINWLNNNLKYRNPLILMKDLGIIVSLFIPATLLIVAYYSIRIEIETYWAQLFIDSTIKIKHQGSDYFDNYQNTDLLKFQTIWIINYSLLFLSLLSLANIKRLKNKYLGLVNMWFNAFVILVFLVEGLIVLSELGVSYINQTLAEYYPTNGFYIGIRYISYSFVGITLYSVYRYTIQTFIPQNSKDLVTAFDCLLYITLIWIASSELIIWLDIMKVSESSRLGLSILWGSYAVVIIVLGIWKKKKHLRIGAIALFGITLLKLFFYDIRDLDTISKTIVFVSLGVLLLIISFLYNKYKNIISG